MWINSEGLGHASLSHRDERHGVDETQPPLTPLEQQVKAGLMERLVDPDHLDQRREVGAKTSDRFETEPPAGERVGFDKNKRRRHQRSLPRPEGRKRARRLGMVLVLWVEQRQEAGCVRKGDIHP